MPVPNAYKSGLDPKDCDEIFKGGDVELARPNLDLISTTLRNFDVVQSNSSLPVESERFHHLHGGRMETSTVRRGMKKRSIRFTLGDGVERAGAAPSCAMHGQTYLNPNTYQTCPENPLQNSKTRAPV